MEIEFHTTVSPDDWGRLVREDPQATFFHTQPWARLLAGTVRGMSACYVTGRAGGALVAGLPLMRIRRAPFAVLASMPYGTLGGPLLAREAPPDAAREITAAFARLARSPLVAAAHLSDFSGRITDAPPGFSAACEEAQIVRLNRDAAGIEAGYRPSVRNKIRKAEKASVVVRRARGERDFLEYARILAECSVRWGARCDFGRPFFSELSRLDGDSVQMWLAEHEGTVIGGDLNFALHGMVVNWGNVSTEAARHLAPNNLLHARAIEEARRAGLSIFNLGASAGIEGVDAFKASFGTERAPYTRFTLEKPWYRTARRAFRRPGGSDA